MEEKQIASLKCDEEKYITLSNTSLKGDEENYVSCLAFAYPSDQIQGFLLSRSDDSTVRLWNFIDGILLDTCKIGAKAGLIKAEESKPAVTYICTSQDGSLIAITIQRQVQFVRYVKCLLMRLKLITYQS
uniref:Uncharacterized protein n=1 Tax=Ananas comosus var. bracteatus TaxID=296719 RepID=A0A6V7PWF5_ANACO|nr:unnamed protein product [Ananas comosus var. bracteatus]